ncbi:MAG: OmpA family protein [Desulfatiglandales bacterium]
MALASNKKQVGQNNGMDPNSWMTTFSDLVTLLLTFFVLLFSFNSMDDKKLETMFGNFNAGSGVMSFKEYRKIARPKEILIEGLRSFIDKRLKELEKTRPGMDTDEIVSGEFEEAGDFLDIVPIRDGFKLVFGAEMFFPSAEAEIREEMKPVLQKIADFLRVTSYQVYIEGHTDNIPLRQGPYASNEELSTARALSVVEYLVRQAGVPASAVAAIGLGEMRPRASNADPAGRSQNRRVEIICKDKRYY